MTPETSNTGLKIWTDPWGNSCRECGESSVSEMHEVFGFIGGGSLSSSFGTYWIDSDSDGGWTLWQTLPGSGEWDSWDEDSEEEQDEPSIAYASAGCRGRRLDAKTASTILLTALWKEHRKTGYDHPNCLAAVESGGILSIEEVEAIIKEVFA
jgi:hypothetical protein